MKTLFLIPTYIFDFLMGMIPVTVFGYRLLPVSKLTYAPSSELLRNDEERVRNKARKFAYEVKKDFL